MSIIWKAAALVILTVILGSTIGKNEKDIAVILTVVACCGVLGQGIHALSDVISFLWQLSGYSDNQQYFGGILLKIIGVAAVSEMTALISTDAGNSSLGKAMLFLGNTMIMSLSLPLFNSFIEIVQEILNIVW